MVILILSISVCVLAVLFLLNAKPNLFIFQLLERVFSETSSD